MKMFNRKKYFFVSMYITILVMLLLIFLIVIEKNARNVLFANEIPFFSYSLSENFLSFVKFHFMGKEFVINFPD